MACNRNRVIPYAPLDVYRTLLTRFGPQGWWPVTPAGKIHPVYHINGDGKRLSERHMLEVSVGAVLTQNTAWSNVEKAIARLHEVNALGAARSAKKILKMPLARLENLIRSSGYFRQKALRLKTFLRDAQERGGFIRWFTRRRMLRASSTPSRCANGAFRLQDTLTALRMDLLSVSGIGPETADSILLYAGALPVFVVDAYTMRIGDRLGWFDPFRKRNGKSSYSDVRDFLVRRLPKSVRVYQEFHALFVALAKFYCRTEPLCPACPLVSRCRYGFTHAD